MNYYQTFIRYKIYVHYNDPKYALLHVLWTLSVNYLFDKHWIYFICNAIHNSLQLSMIFLFGFTTNHISISHFLNLWITFWECSTQTNIYCSLRWKKRTWILWWLFTVHGVIMIIELFALKFISDSILKYGRMTELARHTFLVTSHQSWIVRRLVC